MITISKQEKMKPFQCQNCDIDFQEMGAFVEHTSKTILGVCPSFQSDPLANITGNF